MMKDMNVVIYRDMPASEISALANEFPRVEFRAAATPDGVEPLLASADVIFGNIPAGRLARAPRLKWLQIVSTGIDEYVSLGNSGITVTTAHGIHARVIAEHLLMSVLWFARGMPFFRKAQAEARWARNPAVPALLEKSTIGFVGCGAIAREFLRVVAPFKANIMATDINTSVTPPGVAEVMPPSEISRMLSMSDHILVMLPLTPDTRNILGARQLEAVRQGACLHNVARGGLVDEAKLLELLKAGRIAGAAIDVFENEPLPKDHPFWGMDNVLVTPHIAGHSRELGSLVLDRFKTNLRRFIKGEEVSPSANFARGY
jgi:phosphoglycerate dehydrogenase-like enzyme